MANTLFKNGSAQMGRSYFSPLVNGGFFSYMNFQEKVKKRFIENRNNFLQAMGFFSTHR